ncbi:MAG: sugar ABC transporter ATP-binding protein [Lachnospiraceae bacterium]|nr:sugar ABC transporter ATP-binding protein [Lachnospiraceae bacterium]
MLRMEYITKAFPGVLALDNISLSVEKGAIHALVGENGAGKSTLMKILSGAYTLSCGQVFIENEEIKGITPALMIEKGVAVIYQELMLLTHQTVAENIYLGNFPKKNGLVDYKRMEENAQKILNELKLDLSPKAIIQDLSVAKRQMVEIAKAMSRNAKIIVLDEPTAVLGESELRGLFEIVKRLSKQGITFIYISHRLKEIFELCTSLTILKDGKVVESGKVEDYDTDKLIKLMVGRDMSHIYPPKKNHPQEVILTVDGLTRGKELQNVSFNLRKGEILGIAGLAGAGRTEILRAIIGADKYEKGVIKIDGVEKKFNSPKEAIKAELGIVPEERKTQGLMLKQDITYNVGIAALDNFKRGGLLRPKLEVEAAKKYINMFHIRPSITNILTMNMSGGNQQKVVLSKWINANCRILLVDEPTRGIDIGAKEEIYQILNGLVERGMSIIMVSSELPELLGTCDRIMIMCEGRMTGMLDANDATEELLMTYATKYI